MGDFVVSKRGRTVDPPSSTVSNAPATSDLQSMIAETVAKEVQETVAKEVQAAMANLRPPPLPQTVHTGSALPQEGALPLTLPSQWGATAVVPPFVPSVLQSMQAPSHNPNISLQQSVENAFGSDLSMIDTRVTFDVPLGATLSKKLRAKIINREYIDLYLLLDPSAEEERDNEREVHPRNLPARKVKDIHQWVSAMLIYGAVYLQHNTTEVAPFFKYLEMVRGMDTHTNNNSWRSYDETFRRARQWSPLAWDRPLVHQYMGAMLQPSPTGNSLSKSHKQQPFLTGLGNTIPRSFCFGFNTNGCNKATCTYLHRCPKCNSESHTVDDCRHQPNPLPSN